MKMNMRMEKIKRIKEFRLEQERLARREKELKQLIHSDWVEVKEGAKLKNILKSRLTSAREKKRINNRSWMESLSASASLFARKIARQAEKKIETRVNEKIDSVLNGFFNKGK